MSLFGFGGYNHVSPLLREKEQHVSELFQRFPHAKAINSDRSVIDMPFELSDGKSTALRITLPPHFPQERPTLSVLLPIQHPVVDSTGRVHTPLCSNWVYGGTKLVDAVAEAAALLSGSSGRPMGGASAIPNTTLLPHSNSIFGPPPPGPSGSNSGPPPPNYLGQPPPGMNPPVSPHGIGPTHQPTTPQSANGPPSPSRPFLGLTGGRPPPDLSALSVDELEALMTDEERRKTYIAAVLRTSPMSDSLDQVRKRNTSLARGNLARQDAMSEARNQLAIVRGSEYEVARQRADALMSRQAAVLAAVGPQKIRARLHEAATQLDNKSNDILLSFSGGNGAVEAFVDEYLRSRISFHELDLKRQAAEKLL